MPEDHFCPANALIHQTPGRKSGFSKVLGISCQRTAEAWDLLHGLSLHYSIGMSGVWYLAALHQQVMLTDLQAVLGVALHLP
jgi:hypothetical protein